MSYDIHMQRFGAGNAAPAASPEKVWALLADAWEAPPDQFNYCRVRRGEGEADLYATQPGEPIDSLMFSRAAGGSEIFDLIYDVAQAGDMVIIPPDVGPFVVHDDQRMHLPADFVQGEVTRVTSGAHLLRLIEE